MTIVNCNVFWNKILQAIRMICFYLEKKDNWNHTMILYIAKLFLLSIYFPFKVWHMWTQYYSTKILKSWKLIILKFNCWLKRQKECDKVDRRAHDRSELLLSSFGQPLLASACGWFWVNEFTVILHICSMIVIVHTHYNNLFSVFTWVVSKTEALF